MLGNNRSFARRQAQFTSSTTGRYVRMSVDSCMDNASEDGDASSISARSTRSLRSFRHWKKAQRRRRRLEKSASVFEFASFDDSFRTKVQASGYNHGKSVLKRQDMSVTGDTTTHADGIADDKTERNNGIDRTERTADEELLQQPYYSSSPLTSSDSDSDEPSTSERSPVLMQDASVKGTSNQSMQSSKNKDPLQRRSYPFIYQKNTAPRSNALEETGAGLNDELLLQAISKPRQKSTLSQISDRNVIQGSVKEPPASPVEISEPNVFSSEIGDFTVTVPMNSPTKPSLPTPRHSLEKSSSEEFTQEDHDQDAVLKLIEESNRKREDWRRQNGCNQQAIGSCGPTESRSELLKQDAIEIEPGMYFLPPLITTAMRNQHVNNADLSTETKPHNLSVCLEEEESSCPEIDAREICTEEGLLKLAIRALPESDTCSVVTECSEVEDIEPACLERESCAVESEIEVVELSREADYLEAVNSIPVQTPVDCSGTVTISNGERHLPVERATEARKHSHKVHKSCPSCDRSTRKKVKVQKVAEEEKEEIPSLVPNGLFSHKVAKDERCPVCNRESGGKNIESTCDTSEKVEEEIFLNKPVHSHRVGDDRNCPECSSQNRRLNSDALTGLCCVIV